MSRKQASSSYRARTKPRPAPRDFSESSLPSGATSRITTRIRLSKRKSGSIARVDQAMLGQVLDRMLEARIEPLPVHELQRVNRELEIDRPPGPNLMSSGPEGFLCRVMSSRIFAASARVFAGSRLGRQDRSDASCKLLALFVGAVVGRARQSAICSQVQASLRW